MSQLGYLPSVRRLLVLKDWQLLQKIAAAYVAGGIFALSLLGVGTNWSFYIGSIATIMMLTAIGYHSILLTIIIEKKEQTVPFIMSLPVSPTDFYLAKLMANMIIFLVPWCVIVGFGVFFIINTPIPNGILAYAILACVQIIVIYGAVLSVAIATESEGWTILAMVIASSSLNPVLMLLPKHASIGDYIKGEEFVWSFFASGFLAAQLALVLAMLIFSWWVHSRKKTFL